MATIPTVHLNGTGGKDLRAQMENVCTALHAASEAMDAAAPNGRDYYPQNISEFQRAIEEFQSKDSYPYRVGAFNRAVAEHRARLQKLAEIETECEAIWQGIADQMPD